MTRTEAQRAAEARYNKKRKGTPQVLLRLTPKQLKTLDVLREKGESRQQCIIRVLNLDR